ncbi:hypothetical protein, partial [Pseudonocardia lacus]|uniref:hypothetical protein n=1 Tax=Pseudonocardia lacus TaxID=2835865 RepID=UPI001BDC5A08
QRPLPRRAGGEQGDGLGGRIVRRRGAARWRVGGPRRPWRARATGFPRRPGPPRQRLAIVPRQARGDDGGTQGGVQA